MFSTNTCPALITRIEHSRFQVAHWPQLRLEPAHDPPRQGYWRTATRRGTRRAPTRGVVAGRPVPGPWPPRPGVSRVQAPGEKPPSGALGVRPLGTRAAPQLGLSTKWNSRKTKCCIAQNKVHRIFLVVNFVVRNAVQIQLRSTLQVEMDRPRLADRDLERRTQLLDSRTVF